MPSKKIRVALFFGGRSSEHEISLRSARNVFAALDKSKYDVVLVGIDRQGTWHLGDESRLLLGDPDAPDAVSKLSEELTLVPRDENGVLLNLSKQQSIGAIDVAFPVLHGSNGEDGTIQGLFKLANIPFVGPGVLGSAVAMDKDIAKRLFRDAGLAIADFVLLRRGDAAAAGYDTCAKKLGKILFVKPANCGSSVGVSKVTDAASFKKAVDLAFRYDTKVLVEEAITGREIECSVLGNEAPIASIPGEIVPSHEFYSYEAKYLDDKGAAIQIPARLTPEQTADVRELAVRAYRALNLEGMSRVDFFLSDKGKFLVNEINTIPGFTNISMYPKMWEATGIPYAELLDRLITLAVERHKTESSLSTSR